MSQDHVESTQAADDEGRELDQKVAEYVKLGLPLGTVVCAIVAGVFQGPAAVILVLAAGALVGVIAIFWTSVRTLVGETPLAAADAYALGAPRAEEEQKRAVLRGLKDLEFERSVGKISDEDYQELVTRYRAEAKRLLRLLEEDSGESRQKVEDMVRERLLEEGLAELDGYRAAPAETKPLKNKKKARGAKDVPPKKEPAKEKAPPPDEEEPELEKEQPPPPEKIAKEPAKAPASEERPACASCGTRNDADAVFCKKCGERQLDDESEGEGVDEGEQAEKEAS